MDGNSLEPQCPHCVPAVLWPSVWGPFLLHTASEARGPSRAKAPSPSLPPQLPPSHGVTPTHSEGCWGRRRRRQQAREAQHQGCARPWHRALLSTPMSWRQGCNHFVLQGRKLRHREAVNPAQVTVRGSWRWDLDTG